MYFIPLSTHVRESNLFQTLIYSSQGIQFILDLLSTHAKKSNDLHPYLFMSGNPMLQILTLNVGRNNLTLTMKPTLKRKMVFKRGRIQNESSMKGTFKVPQNPFHSSPVRLKRSHKLTYFVNSNIQIR